MASYCRKSQNDAIPHINRSILSIEATAKSCFLMLSVAVFLFLLRKSKNNGAIRRNTHAARFRDEILKASFGNTATCVTGVTPGYARRLSTKQNDAQAINTL